MKSISLILMLLAFASSANSNESFLEAHADVQYRWESLKWKIDNHKHIHDTFCSMEWNDIQAIEAAGGILYRPFKECWSWIYLQNTCVQIEGGVIVNGHCHDFKGHINNSIEDLNSIFTDVSGNRNSVRGEDLSVCIGQETCLSPCIRTSMFVGYYFQNRRFAPGTNDFSADFPESEGTIDYSINHFRDQIKWEGAWVGIKINSYHHFDLCGDVHFLSNLEYHCGLLHEKTSLQVSELFIDDFEFDSHKKTTNKGNYNGFLGKLGMHIFLTPCIKIGLEGCYQWLGQTNGKTKFFSTNSIVNPNGIIIGSPQISENKKKAKTKWHAIFINATITYEF